jgi:hypothetical protein
MGHRSLSGSHLNTYCIICYVRLILVRRVKDAKGTVAIAITKQLHSVG